MSNLQYVHVGQSAQQLEAALGRPKRTKSKGSSDLWYYEIYSDDSSKAYAYVANFESGTLKTFDPGDIQDSESQKLCIERKKSNQTLFPFTGGNNAPPLKVESCGD